MKKWLLLNVAVGCLSFHATPASERTVIVDFSKIKTKEDRSDTVRGTIFYFGDRLTVKIHQPRVQYMIYDSLRTTIYNPDEHAGVEFHRKNKQFLPFFQTFIGFFLDNSIDPQVKFRIDESMRRGDTLVTRWVSDDRNFLFSGSVEMVYYKDIPIRTVTYDKKKRAVSLMSFSRDTLIDNRHVPLRIVTRTNAKPFTLCEDVSFCNVVTGKAVPREIRDYAIPSDVTLKVIEW
jgi:hypothetical protein